MKSATLGTGTSAAEVTNISAFGIWILLNNAEYFLPFDKFPWFAEAPVKKILNVETPGPNHLYWPDLDIDLTTEIITNPDNYPLVSGITAIY